MYAIIEIRGRQIKVSPQKVYKLPYSSTFLGKESVDWDKVLMLENDGEIILGKPYIDGARVNMKIIRHGKERKIVVFKYKNKIDYRRKYGYRDLYTLVKVEDIKS